MYPPLRFIFIFLAWVFTVSAQDYGYESCKEKLEKLNKTHPETVSRYLWNGTIAGFRGQDPDEKPPTALGYEGCLEICGGRTDKVTTRSALEMVATWIFPLAIVFNLPYDSLHHKKARGTIQTVLNWAGSPQTALTHTIWNVRQIRHCHRTAKSGSNLDKDAYYVLSCLGQFEFSNDEIFYKALVYGLFRPLSGPHDAEYFYTARLLSMLAFQLRMLRRRGVIPTLLSLLTFIAAFVFSLLLAFHEEAGNRTGSPLTLGLLYCWLPLLVIFTIIDRNPVSADRSAALISRWLYNVNAVMISAQAAGTSTVPPAGASSAQASGTSLTSVQTAGTTSNNMPTPKWWSCMPQGDDLGVFRIGEFIGQGRKIKYCGLADATIRAQASSEDHEEVAAELKKNLNGARPTQWYVTAVVSLFLVVFEVMMAFLIAFYTPTFGLGCWSGGLLLYGLLSTLTWTYHLVCKAPGERGQLICSVFNFLALGWLITLTGFVLAGGFRTCWCSTVQLFYPYSGGYMMFKSFDYYVKNFAMNGPWVVASVLGGLVPGAVLVTAYVWWMRCQHLWSTKETKSGRDPVTGGETYKPDTSWLVA